MYKTSFLVLAEGSRVYKGLVGKKRGRVLKVFVRIFFERNICLCSSFNKKERL